MEKANYTIVMLGADRERVTKLESVLADYDIEAAILDGDGQLMPGIVQVIEGDLQAGFELPMQKLAVLTEEELFKKRVKRQRDAKNYLMQSVLRVTLN